MTPTPTLPRAWDDVPALRHWQPDDALLHWSPYTWKAERPAAGGTLTWEACMPGAYVRLRLIGSSRLGLAIDAEALAGSPPGTAPVIEYALDHGPYQTLTLAPGSAPRLSLAEGLDPTRHHELHLVFRAGTLHERWASPRPRLRLRGFLGDAAATLAAVAVRPRTIIGWGDSITEGVGVDALFTSWSELGPNHARGTWLPVVAQALDAEYGQLGTGGQSLTAAIPGGLPPLTQTWSIFDASTASRLRDGRLWPAPEVAFCNMGTNDRVDPSSAYAEFLTQLRPAAPTALLAVVVPINGWWRQELRALVARQRRSDPRVVLIDCPTLAADAPATGTPTSLAYDGVHPTLHGEALFGATIAVQAELALRGLAPGAAATP